MVQRLISYGADFEQRTAGLGRTPMHVAASKGRLEVVEYLIARGAALQYDGVGDLSTPLISAAREGHTAVVSALIQAGANVDAADVLGVTAVYCAASNGKIFLNVLLVSNAVPRQAPRTYYKVRSPQLQDLEH